MSSNDSNQSKSFGDYSDDIYYDKTIENLRLSALEEGTLLGVKQDFRLEKKLGQGGMGQAWLAAEIRGGEEIRKVVCKLLPKPVQDDAAEMNEILKIFQLTQGVSHPNVCQTLDLEKDPVYGWFLVMAYANGQTLTAWFAEHPEWRNGLELKTVLDVLEPVASGLDYVHTLKIVHRDIKPSNIMFSDGVVKILDFGLAAQIHEAATMTSKQMATGGTPLFMAPEQCLGELQNAQTDQYSLATMAYLFLSGSTPFRGVPSMIGMQIVSKLPKPIPTLSPAANSALLKALSKDPADRFATCGEFVRALGGNVVSVVPSAPPVRPKTMEELQREFYEKFKVEEAERERVAEAQRLAREQLEAEKRAKEAEARKIAEAEKRAKAEAQRLEAEKLVKEDAKRKAGELLILKVNGIEYRFRWCPAGSFMMGSPKSEEDRYDHETQHKVTLTQGFWLLETEVTQEQWQAIMGNNPSHFKGKNLPVEQVSWNDCYRFCEKFNAASSLKIDFPTEAQWEYACRAGTTGAYAGNLDEMGWYDFNSGSKSHEVGQKKPNAWGLYDMHGNVFEWCLDLYDSDYYAASPTSDPLNSKKGTDRVIRGGSRSNYAGYCRSAYRYDFAPDRRGNNLGFRPLLVLSCPGSGS